MKTGFSKYGLPFIMLLSVAFYFLITEHFTGYNRHPAYAKMKQASALASAWFEQIALLKKEKSIVPDNFSQIPYKAMIGDDYTLMTSTLGSLEAKELSARPEFAALMVALLLKAHIDSTQKVGVLMTGSFPALAVCTLAALQTLHIPAVIFSSLSASCYGANQPRATWLDMETRLQKFGGLRYKTFCVSIGSENDNGDGLTDEGRQMILEAAQRNRRKVYIPASLNASIAYKMKILLKEQVKLVINIGGSQAAVGGCSHASTIPFGLNFHVQTCKDSKRGILFRMAEKGIPFIHLLHIKDLARKYGISAKNYNRPELKSVYYLRKIDLFVLLLSVGLIFISLIVYKLKKREITGNNIDSTK